MRKFYAFLICVGLYSQAHATIKTAVNNTGTGWSVNNNWSPSGVPQDGDTVIIPIGFTLSIKNTVYNDAGPSLVVEIRGTLDFDPSGKLYLASTSKIGIFPTGQITSNSTSSELITIGGVTKFNGQIDGNLSGPKIASAATGESPLGFTTGVLAIKMVSFTAERVNQSVRLHWSASHDNDNDQFLIQRSVDQSTWITLSTLPVSGSMYSVNDYGFTDNLPVKGMNLYRIVLRNYQQPETYSKTIAVNLSFSSGGLTVYPNPAKSGVRVSWEPVPGSETIFVLLKDLQGRTVYKQNVPASENFLYLQTNQQPAGMYMLVVTDGKQMRLQKPVVLTP